MYSVSNIKFNTQTDKAFLRVRCHKIYVMVWSLVQAQCNFSTFPSSTPGHWLFAKLSIQHHWLSRSIFNVCRSFVPHVLHLHLSPQYDVWTIKTIHFLKALGSRISKLILHKYKYTNRNTQIHTYSIWRSARKTQDVAYFWKEDYSRIA